MSTAHPAQPEGFSFSDENRQAAQSIIAKFPEGRQASAVLPLLDLAQRQNDGWLPAAAIETVADLLDMAPIRVWEVATFYSMYNLKPVGRHLVQVCTNISCWLRGADQVVEVCQRRLGIGFGETTDDREFTLLEVECLGACVNAPMAQIGDDYYEDLDAERMTMILDALKAGESPPPGSQTGRQTSAPATGPTTLTSLKFGGEP